MVTNKQGVIVTLNWNTEADITSQTFCNLGVNKILDANPF